MGRRQAGSRPPRSGRRSLAPPFPGTALAIRAAHGAEAAVAAAERKEEGARREAAAAAGLGLDSCGPTPAQGRTRFRTAPRSRDWRERRRARPRALPGVSCAPPRPAPLAPPTRALHGAEVVAPAAPRAWPSFTLNHTRTSLSPAPSAKRPPPAPFRTLLVGGGGPSAQVSGN